MAKRGHTNIKEHSIGCWPAAPKDRGMARIEIWGGATAFSTKEFPPLVLFYKEWLLIGQRMGWTTELGNVNIVLEEPNGT